ncbi:hypothetical protein [Pseudomonas paeninsulae]|uniref:hypothetical protein n=1 Tax=Pseudomonas paeninsulae TaxID=3110772 RepID=UPI002D7A3340|nr:hypothetical protein [Pseudomonas sp. IT1137]
MSSKPPIDWESIERDYRAGLLSVREIASARSTSHTAINKRAKRDGWDRDLKAKIKARADALVSKQEVSTQVSTAGAETEREIVESNALAIVSVRMNHRTDISRSRRLANALLEELEGMTGSRELFAQLGVLLASPDGNGQDKLSELYHKVIALPGRSKVLKELSDTLKTMITLERQAYNLDDQQHEDTYEDRLKRLMSD